MVGPVPYLFGRTRVDAEKLTDAAGFTTRFVGPGGPDATVIAQSIEAGQLRPHGTQIVLRMGLVEGGGTTAPRLLGLNRDAASSRAVASGLKPLFYGPNEAGLLVASQSVPPGQQVARGTYIQLQMRASTVIVRMPSFSGLTMDEARALAAANHLRPTFSGDEGQGSRVVSQTPDPGSETSSGADVELRLGIRPIRVPRFVGRPRAVAMAIAAKTGLTLNVSGDESVSARVSQQTPSSGTSVAPASEVAIVMAAAAQNPGLIVPQLTGLTRTEAASALGGSNLRMESTGSISVNAVVVSQSPAAGTNAASNDIVRVALGAPGRVPVSVPDVANDTRVAAVSALTASGFKTTATGDLGDSARVVAQQPAAGTPIPQGSSVAITLKTPNSAGWLAPLGVLAAAAAALLAWFVFKRPKPDQIVVPPTPTPQPRPEPKPVAPVLYRATIDAGRPTVRFAHEPSFAARALTLPRSTEGRDT